MWSRTVTVASIYGLERRNDALRYQPSDESVLEPIFFVLSHFVAVPVLVPN